MQHITVLAGGTSSEREVSLRSGQAVAKALQNNGYTVSVFDPADGLEDIGTPDAVFIALHGKSGEDGTIQKELDARHIPYVGADVPVSRLCFDKVAYKKMLSNQGIRTPASEIVTAGTMWQSPLIAKSFVLKPVDGGSSIDTFIIRTPDMADRAAINAAFATNGQMLLEELIEGVEITVGILGETPLPVIEIIPPADGEFDYENKYNGKTQELCPPLHVSESLQKEAQELALRIHLLTRCRDLSRTDMIIDPSNNLVVLETNTIPGMTSQSLFPKMAATAGIPMEQLVQTLVGYALARV